MGLSSASKLQVSLGAIHLRDNFRRTNGSLFLLSISINSSIRNRLFFQKIIVMLVFFSFPIKIDLPLHRHFWTILLLLLVVSILRSFCRTGQRSISRLIFTIIHRLQSCHAELFAHIPYRVTMVLAIFVACSDIIDAPVVMNERSTSSAARPPVSVTILLNASSCSSKISDSLTWARYIRAHPDVPPV